MAYRIKRLGWLPDPPDFRDWKVRHESVQRRLKTVLPRLAPGPMRSAAAPLPAVGTLRADLRQWCSPVEDQGDIGSCTAQAVVGALEYFERKSRGVHVDASRLFLYKATRRYLGWQGDTGAFVRSAIKALRLFGACPEIYWPQDPQRFDEEPEAFHYSLAQNFKALEYFRLDQSAEHLKSALDSGLPFVFGFTCFSSLFDPAVSHSGVVPYPGPEDSVEGGHAVVAVGYSDSHVLFRNSWGEGWGQSGYGYLPWSYFDWSHPLANDCWALVNAAWVPSDDADREIGIAGIHGAVAARTTPRVVTTGRLDARPSAARTPSRAAIAPLIGVVIGRDPIRALPLRLTAAGVEPNESAIPTLPTTLGRVSLYLKEMALSQSFDFSLFGRAVNELYFSAFCWDLSGEPPFIYPPPGVNVGKLTLNMEERQRREFIGDGVLIWPPRKVVGGLYVRLILMENDDDVRDIGKRMESIRKAIQQSALSNALGVLVGGALSAGQLAAVGAAADVIVGVVAELLQGDGDDLVAVFEGTYGADRALVPRTESYDQQGASVVFELRVDEPAVRANAGRPARGQSAAGGKSPRTGARRASNRT